MPTATPRQYAPPLLAVTGDSTAPVLALPHAPGAAGAATPLAVARGLPSSPAAAPTTVSARTAARLWAAAAAAPAARQAVCRAHTPSGRVCLAPAGTDPAGLCPYHRAQVAAAAATAAATAEDEGADVGVDAGAEGAGEGPLVPWDERLAVVLDLDQTLVYTPADGDGVPAGCAARVHWIVADGVRMPTAVRPHALEFLQQLGTFAAVYVVTGGTPAYCDAVVALLNRLVAQRMCSDDDDGNDGNDEHESHDDDHEESSTPRVRAGDALPAIRLGVSCRASSTAARPKTFALVLPRAADRRLALAVDNCRRAWAPACRAQVVVVPDWAPQLLVDEQERVLRHVLARILAVRARLRRRALAAPAGGLLLPAALTAGDVLQGLYEEEEKARILRAALAERVDTLVRLMREQVYL